MSDLSLMLGRRCAPDEYYLEKRPPLVKMSFRVYRKAGYALAP
jgi:hypothetical protein